MKNNPEIFRSSISKPVAVLVATLTLLGAESMIPTEQLSAQQSTCADDERWREPSEGFEGGYCEWLGAPVNPGTPAPPQPEPVPENPPQPIVDNGPPSVTQPQVSEPEVVSTTTPPTTEQVQTTTQPEQVTSDTTTTQPLIQTTTTTQPQAIGTTTSEVSIETTTTTVVFPELDDTEITLSTAESVGAKELDDHDTDELSDVQDIAEVDVPVEQLEFAETEEDVTVAESTPVSTEDASTEKGSDQNITGQVANDTDGSEENQSFDIKLPIGISILGLISALGLVGARRKKETQLDNVEQVDEPANL